MKKWEKKSASLNLFEHFYNGGGGGIFWTPFHTLFSEYGPAATEGVEQYARMVVQVVHDADTALGRAFVIRGRGQGDH